MALAHLVVGRGNEDVLVLPDWFGGSTYYRALSDYADLQRYTYRVIDFRGYGDSRDTAGEYTIAEMAADALALADGLNIDRFHVVGHSMGGKAVQLLAAQNADRLRSAVALTPTPPVALELDDGTRGLLETCKDNPESRRTALGVATGSQYSAGFIDCLVKRSMEASAPDAYRAYLDAWSRTDITPHLQPSDFPLHVILGSSDPFVPASAIEATLRPAFSKMRVTELPGIGHYPLLEVPAKTVTLLEAEFAGQA